MLEVIKNACSTCIYRKDSVLNLNELEEQIKDKNMEGYFNGYRICHNHNKAVCRGFWNQHKNDFDLGQLAQRLGLVIEVEQRSKYD